MRWTHSSSRSVGGAATLARASSATAAFDGKNVTDAGAILVTSSPASAAGETDLAQAEAELADLHARGLPVVWPQRRRSCCWVLLKDVSLLDTQATDSA